MTGYEISGSHCNFLSCKHCSTDFWYWMLWRNLRPAWHQPLIKDFVLAMRRVVGCPKESLSLWPFWSVFLGRGILSIYKFQFCEILIVLTTICCCTEFLLQGFHFYVCWIYCLLYHFLKLKKNLYFHFILSIFLLFILMSFIVLSFGLVCCSLGSFQFHLHLLMFALRFHLKYFSSHISFFPVTLSSLPRVPTFLFHDLLSKRTFKSFSQL